MKRVLSMAALAALFPAHFAQAAPVQATSTLNFTHDWEINGGTVPTGIDIGAGSPQIQGDIGSSVDDPAAENTNGSSVQIGNPYTDPVTPFVSQRNDNTLVQPGFQGAGANYFVSVTTTVDPDYDQFHRIGNAVVQSGSAAIQFDDSPVASAANASYRTARDVFFENNTNSRISFNITGTFDVDFAAEFIGDDGFARTSGGFELLFEDSVGTTFNYFPVSPYLNAIEELGAGATLTERLLVNSGGISGLSFNGAASAIGDGGTTRASFEGNHRYVLGLTMDPGASTTMHTDFRFSNTVGVDPQPDLSSVPLPSSLLPLLFGLAGLAGMQRLKTRRRVVSS